MDHKSQEIIQGMKRDLAKEIRDNMEKWRKAKLIICPYCGREHEVSEFEDYAPVTYWGEDEPKHMTCSVCNEDFWTQERVERTFKSAKTKS